MNTSTTAMPRDCVDSFGKLKFRSDSGQAHLQQWPLKLKHISLVAPYFHRAHLMLAADCAAFSYRNFHGALLRNRVLVIGCPELDGSDFSDELEKILKLNDILSIAVVRMDAPCCGSFANIVIDSVRKSGKDIPVQFTTVFAEGEILD